MSVSSSEHSRRFFFLPCGFLFGCNTSCTVPQQWVCPERAAKGRGINNSRAVAVAQGSAGKGLQVRGAFDSPRQEPRAWEDPGEVLCCKLDQKNIKKMLQVGHLCQNLQYSPSVQWGRHTQAGLGGRQLMGACADKSFIYSCSFASCMGRVRNAHTPVAGR